MRDLIYRQDAIDAIEEVDWYHQNKNKDMVSGANSSEDQAWYKADDIYKALEALPSAHSEIIRCKDCKYNYGLTHDGEFNPDDIVCVFFDTDGMQYCDFCSYAERRTDETD